MAAGKYRQSRRCRKVGRSPNERRGFVFIGRWIANKGIDTLLDAYALAQLDPQKWPLVLMGEGPLRSIIEYAIQKRAISGIEVFGFVDETTKAERIKNARWIVVPPNTKEDFGLTAVEARNLGVPCIITRDGGLPEAGGRQALICEPNDPHALANLLQQAAAMSEVEYADRATRTREELATELEPMEFYARAYRRIAGREVLPRMILLAHPFGNANVRAVLEALHEADLLAKYFTTLGWSKRDCAPRLLATPRLQVA